LRSWEMETGRLPENSLPLRSKCVKNLQFLISSDIKPRKLLLLRLTNWRDVEMQREVASRTPVRLSSSRTMLLMYWLFAEQVTPCQLWVHGSDVRFQPHAKFWSGGSSLCMNVTRAFRTFSDSELVNRNNRNRKVSTVQNQICFTLIFFLQCCWV
jgi:hypothetical protein